jgi:hypothetical protein
MSKRDEAAGCLGALILLMIPIGYVLLWIGFWGFIGFAIVHFILKWW